MVVFQAPNSGPFTDLLATYVSGFNECMTAITENMVMILAWGVVGSAMVGCAWLIFLRIFSRLAVYLMIGFLLFICIAITTVCAIRGRVFEDLDAALHNHTHTGANDPSLHGLVDLTKLHDDGMAAKLSGVEGITDSEMWFYRGGTAGFAILSIIVMILICAWKKQIETIIELVEESSEMVSAMPTLIIAPFLTCVFVLVLSTYTLLIAMYLGTESPEALGTHTEELARERILLESTGMSPADIAHEIGLNHGRNMQVDYNTLKLVYENEGMHYFKENKKWLLIYHIFGFLWTNQFIQAVGYCTISGALSFWFFKRNDKAAWGGCFSCKLPVLDSLKIVIRYHTGTLAFGTLIIAIVQALRLALEYVNKSTKKLQQANCILALIMKCARCALWCMEKCVKFISYYGFIYTAMNGTGFCTSCKQVFGLFFTYPAQLVVNEAVVGMLSIVQSLAFPLALAIAANFHFVESGAKGAEVASVAVLVVSYTIMRAFATVYECALNTLFVCCVRDAEHYNYEHMPEDLKDNFGYVPDEFMDDIDTPREGDNFKKKSEKPK